MTEITEADFSTGDPVGWHATSRHGAGSGIIVAVHPEDGRIEYTVQKLIDGKAVGDVFRIMQEVVFPIRGLRDPRPQPEPHRRRRSRR